jgi:DHA2 family multidrug resistance protein-like MFS transporter
MTYLQSVLGLSVLGSAVLAIPGAMVLMSACVFAPRLVERIGARHALIVCHFTIALGMALLLLTGERGGVVFYVASTVVAGVGFGISFALVADTAVGAVPESRAATAGAIAETSNEIGNALGIALLGSLATVVFRATYRGGETGINEVIDAAGVGSAAFGQARAAFLDGYHVAVGVAGVVCVGLAVLALRWIPKQSHGAVEETARASRS